PRLCCCCSRDPGTPLTSALSLHDALPILLAEIDRLAHVGVGLRDRLPGLEHLERGQLGAPAPHERRRAEEDGGAAGPRRRAPGGDRKSTRLNSSHQIISYAVFCVKKKKQQ